MTSCPALHGLNRLPPGAPEGPAAFVFHVARTEDVAMTVSETKLHLPNRPRHWAAAQTDAVESRSRSADPTTGRHCR